MRKKLVHLLITTEQVLKKELLEFQQRHIDPTSASLLAESLSLQLFGYITLVKDGHSLGRLHAVNHWKGGTATGKFNGVRIHPSRGRSKVTLRMALTIRGDEITMDFTGTDAQVDRAINCAMCYTYAMCMYGVKVCTEPHLPNNEGAFRPITVTAPPGCIVNPVFPASGGSRMLIGHYLPMLVFGCLGQVVPERVMAACGSPMWGMNQSGVRADGKPYANMFFYNGGMGANHQADGIACLSWPSNVSSTSIEVSEHIAPLRFHHKKLREESGGPGARRGGMGQDILIEVRSPTPIAVSFLAERTVIPAFGVEGGGAGATGTLHINGEKVDPKRQYVLRAGETIQLSTPGGGGHGAA